MTRLPRRNLDVLRALAVLGVLANHIDIAAGDTSISTSFWIAFWLGHAGVLAFFVHTSLVLMSSLEREGDAPAAPRPEATHLRYPRAASFYVRRAFRIYPLAMATVIVARVTHLTRWVPRVGIVDHFPQPGIRAVIANLLLVQNLAGVRDVIVVLWTLPIEVQMYLVLPACYLAARRGVRDVLALFVVAVGLAYLWGANHRLNVLLYAPCFLAGVLAFALLRRVKGPAPLPSWLWPVVVVATFGVTWFVGVRGVPAATLTFDDHHWVQWGYCLALGLAIPLIRELPVGIITRACEEIAKYSYGIYLLHIPALAIGLVLCRWAPIPVQWCICAAMLVVLPVVAYHAIEDPCIKWGKTLATRWFL